MNKTTFFKIHSITIAVLGSKTFSVKVNKISLNDKVYYSGGSKVTPETPSGWGYKYIK